MKTKIRLELENSNPINCAGNSNCFYSELLLPCDYAEIENSLHKIRVTKENMEFLKITLLDCLPLPQLETADINASIEEWNFFAKRLSELSETELRVFHGIFKHKYGDNTQGETIEIKDLINSTYNLNKVEVLPVANDKEYGEMICENDLCAELENVSHFVMEKMIDTEAVGKQFREAEQGEYVDGMYVCVNSYTETPVYDGEHLPSVSERYVFKILVAKAPVNTPDETIGDAVWITLPAGADKVKEVVEQLNEKSIEECVYYDFKSLIPQINEDMFNDMNKFKTLNRLAKEISKMTEAERFMYKAILEANKPTTLDETILCVQDINRYEISPVLLEGRDYARAYIAHNIPQHMDGSFIQHLEFTDGGQDIISKTGVTVTSYGILSPKDGELFQMIYSPFANEQDIEEEESDEGFSMYRS